MKQISMWKDFRANVNNHLPTKFQPGNFNRAYTTALTFRELTQVAQAHGVCHIGKYREHMRRSLGLEICKKMEIKIDETYHVVSCCCL